jgi:DNA-binding GntR family transcriptional regulator
MSVTPVFRTIREQIVEQIRKEVLSGQLVEGDALREESLARRFGVSRGPIRDALLQLSQEGLLQSRPNCGAKVAPGPSLAIQPLVIQLRRQIESFALGLIFDSLTPADLAAIDANLDRLRSACQNEEMTTVVDHDMAFHRWFVERSGDADLAKMWLAVVTRMRLRYTRHTHLMDSFAEHQQVATAIRRGDKAGAIEALVANIQA